MPDKYKSSRYRTERTRKVIKAVSERIQRNGKISFQKIIMRLQNFKIICPLCSKKWCKMQCLQKIKVFGLSLVSKWKRYEELTSRFIGKQVMKTCSLMRNFSFYNSTKISKIIGTWLFLDDRRDARPNPNSSPLLFNHVFFFIIWVVWVDFCFCLHSCDQKFLRFVYFPSVLECCVPFLCFLSSVCVGGEPVSRRLITILECY